MEQITGDALLEKLDLLCGDGEKHIIAIDGRCGSGKTTLARQLGARYEANVVAMDDFYLPMEARPENWLEIPAGNMDLERLRREVLEPLKGDGRVSYRPFDCHCGKPGEEISLSDSRVTIVEGSYSHHPALNVEYDCRIFVTCEGRVQASRLKDREGARWPNFEKRWIPKEEQYFAAFQIMERSHYVIDTGKE